MSYKGTFPTNSSAETKRATSRSPAPLLYLYFYSTRFAALFIHFAAGSGRLLNPCRIMRIDSWSTTSRLFPPLDKLPPRPLLGMWAVIPSPRGDGTSRPGRDRRFRPGRNRRSRLGRDRRLRPGRRESLRENGQAKERFLIASLLGMGAVILRSPRRPKNPSAKSAKQKSDSSSLRSFIGRRAQGVLQRAAKSARRQGRTDLPNRRQILQVSETRFGGHGLCERGNRTLRRFEDDAVLADERKGLAWGHRLILRRSLASLALSRERRESHLPFSKTVARRSSVCGAVLGRFASKPAALVCSIRASLDAGKLPPSLAGRVRGRYGSLTNPTIHVCGLLR